MNTAKQAESLTDITSQISGCRNCPLHQDRRNTVPGTGPGDAEVMIIGEGPGEQEDRQGRPFVGPSGNILKQLLESAGLAQDQVFVTNVIKCRTPNNRAPSKTETKACRHFLERQIAAVRPRLIIAMGASALNWFRPELRITKEQGNTFINEPGQLVFPIMHPAAGMRSPKNMDSIFAHFPAVATWLEVIHAGREPSPGPQQKQQDESPGASEGDTAATAAHDLASLPDAAGPALALTAWLGRQTLEIESDWKRTGEPDVRHRLTALSNLIAAVRSCDTAEEPRIAATLGAAIQKGTQLSRTLPQPCPRCHEWHYPPEPRSQPLCYDCAELQE